MTIDVLAAPAGPTYQPVGAANAFNVRHAPYSARGDGFADDTGAIERALTDAAAQVILAGRPGAVVYLPTGVYLVRRPLFIPFGVTVAGDGYMSIIRADAARFVGGAAQTLVTLGLTADAITFGSRLWRVCVDCAGILNVGVESTKANEFSGLYDVEVRDFLLTGVWMHGSNCQNYTLRHLNLLFSAAADVVNAIAMDINQSQPRGIQDVTVDSLGPNATVFKCGIRLNNITDVVIQSVGLENVVDGVLVGDLVGCSSVVLIGVRGGNIPGYVNNVRIANNGNQGVVVIGATLLNGTNNINDQQAGITHTDFSVALYMTGNGANPQPRIDLSSGAASLSALVQLIVTGGLFVGPFGQNTGITKILHGQATLVAGSKVVNTSPATLVTANTKIWLGVHTPGGAPGWLQVSARVVGTSFTILSSSGTDTSVVDYLMIEP